MKCLHYSLKGNLLLIPSYDHVSYQWFNCLLFHTYFSKFGISMKFILGLMLMSLPRLFRIFSSTRVLWYSMGRRVSLTGKETIIASKALWGLKFISHLIAEMYFLPSNHRALAKIKEHKSLFAMEAIEKPISSSRV